MDLYHKDCFEVMAGMNDNSVDCIITDPPYMTTNLDFDKATLDIPRMISEFERIIKPNRAVVVFASLRFAVQVINANPKFFRYEWIEVKSHIVGFLDCKHRPLKNHEYMLVFGKGKPMYHPQMTPGDGYIRLRRQQSHRCKQYGGHKAVDTYSDGSQYPTSAQFWQTPNYKSLHPTAKPIQLIEYLINTYSDLGDLVLDPFMGSGTTGAACARLKREFIGIELNEKYFAIAKNRIESEAEQQTLF